MDITTFGDVNEFNCLIGLSEEFDKLTEKEQQKVFRVLSKSLCLITKYRAFDGDPCIDHYLYTHFYSDMVDEISSLPSEFNSIKSFMKNYLKAKFRRVFKIKKNIK